jgi:hypothetical protein
MYGSTIQLNMNKDYQHKTVFGGFFTILIILATLLGIYYYGFELVAKTNPETI